MAARKTDFSIDAKKAIIREAALHGIGKTAKEQGVSAETIRNWAKKLKARKRSAKKERPALVQASHEGAEGMKQALAGNAKQASDLLQLEIIGIKAEMQMLTERKEALMSAIDLIEGIEAGAGKA